ncbi:MAG TPA: hypothetical protein VLL47_01150 [Robiginitalea sp.]|nr:hypothetical protein [Robiginitalea sp.]
MKRLLKGLPILLGMLLYAGCDVSDDGAKYYFVPLQITAVDVPESFQLNETYEIGVTYLRPNGCTGFQGFDVISQDSADYVIRRVVAIGAEFQDAPCPEINEELQASFQFICLYSKPYLFRFYTGDDEAGAPQYLEVEVHSY